MTDPQAARQGEQDLWRQVADPFLFCHPEHGVGMRAVPWANGVRWQPGDLEAAPVIVALGVAPLPRLMDVAQTLGLLCYGRAVRETLSGAVLKRVAAAVGPQAWGRLKDIDTVLEPLCWDEHRPIGELQDGSSTYPDPALGVRALAACFAAYGEAWRLRLGVRLPPAPHEAVPRAAPCTRELAQRRVSWACSTIGSPHGDSPHGESPHGDDGEAASPDEARQ